LAAPSAGAWTGRLGRLTLKVPWRNLKSEPVRIVIEGLHVIAIPLFGLPVRAGRRAGAAQGTSAG